MAIKKMNEPVAAMAATVAIRCLECDEPAGFHEPGCPAAYWYNQHAHRAERDCWDGCPAWPQPAPVLTKEEKLRAKLEKAEQDVVELRAKLGIMDPSTIDAAWVARSERSYETERAMKAKAQARDKAAGEKDPFHYYQHCPECGVVMENSIDQHRKEAHDTARGIRSHAIYYCQMTHGNQSGIALIDPRTITASNDEPSKGIFGGWSYDENRVAIRADDRFSYGDGKSHACQVYIDLRPEEAMRLAYRLEQAAREALAANATRAAQKEG